MIESNKKEILDAVSKLLDKNDEIDISERISSLDRKIDAGFNELKNLINLKFNGLPQNGKTVEDIQKEAYNEAYLAIKNENVEKEKAAFSKGVEYGKTLFRNRLDAIEKKLLQEYAENNEDYNDGISSFFNDLI